MNENDPTAWPKYSRRSAAGAALGGIFSLPAIERGLAQTPSPIRESRVWESRSGDIRAAWLSGETQRYRHFVLGGEFEASGLAIRDSAGAVQRLDLPADEVFEDREARIVDLDGDARNEVAVVISRLKEGSLLALFGLSEGKLARIAETPANGRPNRWLNPSGVGRFLGKSEKQIAIVRRPHLDGVLELWSFDGRMLDRRAEIAGYSTHRLGSRHQRLYAVIPKMGGDGDLLAVPTLDRTRLAILDFALGRPEVDRLPLNGKADGEITFVMDRSARPAALISVPLEGGGTARLRYRHES